MTPESEVCWCAATNHPRSGRMGNSSAQSVGASTWNTVCVRAQGPSLIGMLTTVPEPLLPAIPCLPIPSFRHRRIDAIFDGETVKGIASFSRPPLGSSPTASRLPRSFVSCGGPRKRLAKSRCLTPSRSSSFGRRTVPAAVA